jgi:hypothetical protein
VERRDRRQQAGRRGLGDDGSGNGEHRALREGRHGPEPVKEGRSGHQREQLRRRRRRRSREELVETRGDDIGGGEAGPVGAPGALDTNRRLDLARDPLALLALYLCCGENLLA